MRLTLKSKVLLLAMVPVLLFALVLSGGAVLILKKQADAEVKDTRERLLGDRRAELEHYVQIADNGEMEEGNSHEEELISEKALCRLVDYINFEEIEERSFYFA